MQEQFTHTMTIPQRKQMARNANRKSKISINKRDLISNRTNTTFGCRFTTKSSVKTTISN